MARISKQRTVESVPEHRTIAQFESLSDADKEKVWEFYDGHDPLPETRPMTPAERARWEQVQISLKADHRRPNR